MARVILIDPWINGYIKVCIFKYFFFLLLGTYPTCHEFNATTATIDACSLAIGFSAGQIQIINPMTRDSQSRLFNDDRIIDRTAVTCIKWIAGGFLKHI